MGGCAVGVLATEKKKKKKRERFFLGVALGKKTTSFGVVYENQSATVKQIDELIPASRSTSVVFVLRSRFKLLTGK